MFFTYLTATICMSSAKLPYLPLCLSCVLSEQRTPEREDYLCAFVPNKTTISRCDQVELCISC